VKRYLTVPEFARRLGIPAWKVRRLFERGLAESSARFGAYHLLDVADLPRIKKALVEAGYLKAADAPAA
jgi:hypothetical protein